MRVRNEETYQRKKAELMEASFAAYARGGLSSTGIKTLAEECGCSAAALYTLNAIAPLPLPRPSLKNGSTLAYPAPSGASPPLQAFPWP